MEIAEARYGLEVGHKALCDDIAGQGRYSGGRGLTVSYRMRGDALLSAGYSRNRVPVWGLAGGDNGGTNGFAVQRTDGTREERAFASGVVLRVGDEILIHTANGGGWGNSA